MPPASTARPDSVNEELTTTPRKRSRRAGWARFPPEERTRQFIRFLFVGVGNTVLSFATYRLLLALGTPYGAAAAISFSVGALNGYIFNRRWTFAARDSTRSRVLYVVIQVIAAATMSLLVVFFVRVVGLGHVGAYLAAIPLVTVCSFAANRIWTFADRG